MTNMVSMDTTLWYEESLEKFVIDLHDRVCQQGFNKLWQMGHERHVLKRMKILSMVGTLPYRGGD